AVIGFAGGADCAGGADDDGGFSCPSRATGTAINATNTKPSLLFIKLLSGNRATLRVVKDLPSEHPQSTIRTKCQIVSRQTAMSWFVQFRGFSKMTLSSLQAQAPRVILSGFSLSNCTRKTKRKPVCQVCQLRAS